MQLEMCLPATKSFGKTPSFYYYYYYKIYRSLGPLKGSRDLAIFITRKTEKGGSRQAVLIIATLAFRTILFFTFVIQRRNLK